jgi:hypothetical protein
VLKVKILFSYHANERIEKRNVNKTALIRELNLLPPISGVTPWVSSNGDKYVIASTPKGIIVITAVSLKNRLQWKNQGRRKKHNIL